MVETRQPVDTISARLPIQRLLETQHDWGLVGYWTLSVNSCTNTMNVLADLNTWPNCLEFQGEFLRPIRCFDAPSIAFKVRTKRAIIQKPFQNRNYTMAVFLSNPRTAFRCVLLHILLLISCSSLRFPPLFSLQYCWKLVKKRFY